MLAEPLLETVVARTPAAAAAVLALRAVTQLLSMFLETAETGLFLQLFLRL
jgi:hypothetical protein